jgi:hypothetical protein
LKESRSSRNDKVRENRKERRVMMQEKQRMPFTASSRGGHRSCYKGESGSDRLRFGNEGLAEGNTRKGRKGGEVGSCAFFVFWRCPPNVRCGRQGRGGPRVLLQLGISPTLGVRLFTCWSLLSHLLWRRATKEVHSSHSEACHLQATSQSPHGGKLQNDHPLILNPPLYC